MQYVSRNNNPFLPQVPVSDAGKANIIYSRRPGERNDVIDLAPHAEYDPVRRVGCPGGSLIRIRHIWQRPGLVGVANYRSRAVAIAPGVPMESLGRNDKHKAEGVLKGLLHHHGHSHSARITTTHTNHENCSLLSSSCMPLIRDCPPHLSLSIPISTIPRSSTASTKISTSKSPI